MCVCVCVPAAWAGQAMLQPFEMTVVPSHWPSQGWLSMEMVQGSLSLLLDTVSGTLLLTGQLEPIPL